jgi:hypothetical protein
VTSWTCPKITHRLGRRLGVTHCYGLKGGLSAHQRPG